MDVPIFKFSGLTDLQVVESRTTFGKNELVLKGSRGILISIIQSIKEPMILLLLITASIYFVSGAYEDGSFMLLALVLVGAISIRQEYKSKNALLALKDFTKPKSKVIRNGQKIEINSNELVIGDYFIIEEGNLIPADGEIQSSNDFSVNESILTGESLSVFKGGNNQDLKVFMGTVVSSGLAICKLTALAPDTEFGKINKSLETIEEEKTPLQIQINNFVKYFALLGIVIFLVVWLINFYNSKLIFDSLLQSMTLAMSILPEEISVAFSTFMALGAWRLMKKGIIVKGAKTVETLGGANIICIDKTGTITQNKMKLTKLFSLKTESISAIENNLCINEIDILRYAMWASEPIPFDPMEKEIHDFYTRLSEVDERPVYNLVHEYPLEGKPPMMTHVFKNKINGQLIIAAKGAPEALIKVSDLSKNEIQSIEEALNELSSSGYRILGVGYVQEKLDSFPKTQQELHFKFLGLIAFYDPPKPGINKVLKDFDNAGIDVKIITGDNALTTKTILKEVDYSGSFDYINGDDLLLMNESELREKVKSTDIYTRMYPDAKLRLINAMKSNGQVVAMIGDGVNDAPALKASHIGIAMGKKGSEVAKMSSSLILIDDDLGKMIDAISMGRKIYANLKKAIQYIISIHIPIILTVLIPLAFGWLYPNLFTPVHIIFLELIMGPTCSIIYENEPIERNAMNQKPRVYSTTFFNLKELTTSILQGLIITAGTLSVYQYAVYLGYNEETVRTMVYVVLISANIFLTLVNRSFYYSIFTSLRYKNPLLLLIISITIVLCILQLYVPYLKNLFQFTTMNFYQFIVSVSVGFACVIWYEFVKLYKRSKAH